MKLPDHVESSAFRSSNGEYAWERDDIPAAVSALINSNLAILGGELWTIQGGEIYGAIPKHEGPPSIYHWECEQHPNEDWASFVKRSGEETLRAVTDMPGDSEVAIPEGCRIYYNLTWVTETEYKELRQQVNQGDGE